MGKGEGEGEGEGDIQYSDCSITHNVNKSHHLVLVGSDNNYIHDPVQNVPNAGRLHSPSSGGLVARGNVLAAGLLQCQVLQTANLCDGRTEEGHHPAREGEEAVRTYVHTYVVCSPGDQQLATVRNLQKH